MPFDFPLNPEAQKTYMEDFMSRLQALNDQAEPLQVTQSFEPTQADWVAAWEAAGNTGAIPDNKDLYWFDGEYLRGHFSPLGTDLISPFLYPSSGSMWTIPDNNQEHINDVTWRTNDDFWALYWSEDNAAYSQLVRMFPDGSFANPVAVVDPYYGSFFHFVGQNASENFAPAVVSSYGVDLTNTAGGLLYMDWNHTQALSSGQVIKIEVTLSKRESGSCDAVLRVEDTAGSEGALTTKSLSGATGPQKLSAQMTTTGAWTGIKVRLGANGLNHRCTYSGIRIFVDGVELAAENHQNFNDKVTTGWTIPGGITATAIETFWVGWWDGSAFEYALSIPEGPTSAPSKEKHFPFYTYLSGGIIYVVFGWLDVSIVAYDTSSLVSNVLANASSYSGGSTWNLFAALDDKIYATNDTGAIRRFEPDGTGNIAITVDVTDYLTGRNGKLYRVPYDSTLFLTALASDPAWYEFVDIYDVATDTETLASPDVFPNIVGISRQKASYEAVDAAYNEDSVNVVAHWTFDLNPFYTFLETPSHYCERLQLSPSGDRWIASEEDNLVDLTGAMENVQNFILLSNSGGTGRVARLSTWSDPRPDFRILDEIVIGVQGFQTLEFDLTTIEGLEYYDNLIIDLAVEPTVSNQADIHVQFNDDTTVSNYASLLMVQTGSALNSDEEINTQPGIHLQAWQNGTSAFSHMMHMTLLDFQSNIKKKTVMGHGGWTDSYAVTTYHQQFLSGIWESLDPITKITFTIENVGLGELLGASVDGGRIRLIGLKTRSRYARNGDDTFFMA